MEEVTCIFCHRASDDIAIEEDGFLGKRCSNCNLIYISPRPNTSAVIDLYTQDQAHIHSEAHIYSQDIKRRSARHHLRLLKSYARDGNLLEIGAGGGFFLDEARKAGYNVSGVEPNPTLARFIKKSLGIPCEEQLTAKSILASKPFDIIYHRDVLSHFSDPISEFNVMHSLLAQHGIMMFETGNLADVNPEYFHLFTTFQFPDHLFSFGEHSLRMLLKETGFDLIKIYRYSRVPQLLLTRAKAGMIKAEEPDRITTSIHVEASVASPRHGFTSGAKKQAKNVYAHLGFMALYWLGYLMPKKERPQTMIVLARKQH